MDLVAQKLGIRPGILWNDSIPRVEQQRLLRVGEQQAVLQRRVMADNRRVVDRRVADEEKRTAQPSRKNQEDQQIGKQRGQTLAYLFHSAAPFSPAVSWQCRLTVTTVPLPGLLLTDSEALCRAAIFAQRESPSPTPPFLRERDLSVI